MNSLIELNDVALKKQQQYLDSILKDIDQSGNEMEVFGRVMAEPDPFCSTAETYRMHLKNKLESDHFKRSIAFQRR